VQSCRLPILSVAINYLPLPDRSVFPGGLHRTIGRGKKYYLLPPLLAWIVETTYIGIHINKSERKSTMNRLAGWLSVCGIAAGTIGCASTSWNGYQGGTVKASEIEYNYTAQPVLTDPASKTYRIQTDAAVGTINSIPALEKKGVRKAASGADVTINVTSREITHEPGGFGLKTYKPAVFSTMPIKIEVTDKEGREVLTRDLKHEEILTINGAKEYPTREEAKAAMTEITQVLKSSADAKVRSTAPAMVKKNLGTLSKDLFETREVSIALPALRSAGKVDMEAAYKLLADAKSDEQVKAALAAYNALGTGHKKADGTDDTLGNYGVLCGLASAKILCGDMAGAWENTRQAWKMFPQGKEYKIIAKALHQKEQQTATVITQPDEYNEMVKENPSEANSMTNEMMNNFMHGGSR
jgi:hypothetical protein